MTKSNTTLTPETKSSILQNFMTDLGFKIFTSTQQDIVDVGLELIETLIHKNHDYGDSASDAPLLLPDLPPEKAILVRLSDKIKRIQQLESVENRVEDEPLEDAYIDSLGYMILRRILELRKEHNPAPKQFQL